MSKKTKVFLAGHKGMVGAALLRELSSDKTLELVTIDRQKLDLMDMCAVYKYFKCQKFDTVIIASARIGGVQDIMDNPVDFLTDNIVIQANLIMLSHKTDVQNLLFIGSSRLYPTNATQPIKEEALMTGPLDPNIAPYAVAKIAGIKMCEAYRKQYGRNYFAVMPSNLYGVGDKYEGNKSHVVAGLIQRIHKAMISGEKTVTIWGSGKPKREFIYVDDFTKACAMLLKTTPDALTNIGTGTEISIAELATTLAEVIGYKGDVVFDTTKPDGVKSKLMDSSKINAMGFKAQVDLKEGLNFAYMQYLADQTHNACGRNM